MGLICMLSYKKPLGFEQNNEVDIRECIFTWGFSDDVIAPWVALVEVKDKNCSMSHGFTP